MAADDVSSIVSRVVENQGRIRHSLLAQQLGTNYRSLMYWLRGDRPFPRICCREFAFFSATMKRSIFWSARPGRVAFKLPDPKLPLDQEFFAVSRLIRDVGEALESVADTLADGVVEESELRTTIPKLEAVIQECASLKYLLEDLSKKRKRKTKI